MKKIEVIVSRDGATRVETQGFTGSSCQDASRFLENALGTKQEERLTTEFYQAEVSQSEQAREAS